MDITFLGTRFTGATRSGVTHDETPELGTLEEPLPMHKKQFQRLLGHLNWYQHYITPHYLPILARLQRQTRDKLRKATPWTDKDRKDLHNLLHAVKNMPLQALNLTETLVITLGYTANHVWATAHNPQNELVYASHKALQAAQHRYGAFGKLLLAERLVTLLSQGHGTLRAPAATLLPLLDATKVDSQFQGEPATWNEMVLHYHYRWCCWKCEDLPPSPDAKDNSTPTLYGTIAPAWMASDGTIRHGGGYGFYCKPCHDVELYRAPEGATAQRNELLGFEVVIRHSLQHHDRTLPTPIIAIDSQYVYKIVTGAVTAVENLEDWERIWDLLSQFIVLPLVKHTKSHKLETDPVHEINRQASRRPSSE
ncbi:uncharacterized protein LOC112548876 [Alligator sinensis]|uniref:Uncharacterized protein LOC112548876 n=1 Tax=Alligator sinensis TaxID=38654 RepID=A0A3Q0FUY0_ALLSI|nr:uncharacterized protein LOC112548876 [Alligator sinensis]XP_025051427.1 uncharacterized protein LOC112548876 [Alligator sinensis]